MDGILPLWKEKGMTSHDCVFKLRKILKTKKVGHTGTLDPNVEGVLPICIGKATKLAEYLTDSGKEYEGEITLGISTTTEDADGEIVERKAVPAPFPDDEIDKMMKTFIGEITQIPPMYSAVKVKGKRLYEYARKGEVVERPMRNARIQEFKRTTPSIWLQEEQVQKWRFHVSCGKGTYVRTLAVDLGESLGFPAFMSDLTRLKSGGFCQSETFTLQQVAELQEKGEITTCLYSLERGISQFPRLDISADLYEKVKNGSVLPSQLFSEKSFGERPTAVFYQNYVVSLYAPHPTRSGMMKPVKVLRNDLKEGEQ